MKKKVVIDSLDNVEVKKVEKNIYKKKYNSIGDKSYFNWLIYMIGYAIVLVIVSKIFRTFELNTSYFCIYALIAAIIIYILNKTIKPIIKFLTLPLTILSLGILYPLTNIIILYITSFFLGDNFNIKGFLSAFIVAISISFFNMLMEGIFIKPIINRKNGHRG